MRKDTRGRFWGRLVLHRHRKGHEANLGVAPWQADPGTLWRLRNRLNRCDCGRFQLTTDGLRPYLNTMPHVFGSRVDFATLVKVYGESEDEKRYSPARIIEVIETPQSGNPDPDEICTSHVRRSNKTLRMQIRRLTRLTDGHSKKWENHEAALGLFFAYYNFCRVHCTIKTTPAVAAGIALETWSLQRLLDEVNRI